MAKNVLGTELQSCCLDPVTGFYRNGRCDTGPDDHGLHLICAELTAAFLNYSKSRGNDLMTPLPQYGFPGLKPGDRWCLCVSRWLEAEQANVAPPIILEATHEAALNYVPMPILQRYALRAGAGE